ncbi:MAG: response regulator [Candidatus Omnitrophica bacterium]|nr:response regulator [Candidatus Omnitrophota bacterium]
MNSSAQPRILIIDDDQGVIKLTTSILLSNGYEVLSSSEAPAGLEMAMKEKIDLIVLDVMIPIINGFNICRLLKSQEKYKMIPIVLLTSRSEDEDRKIGKEVGADAYIAKPLNRENFLTAIKDLLSKSGK